MTAFTMRASTSCFVAAVSMIGSNVVIRIGPGDGAATAASCVCAEGFSGYATSSGLISEISARSNAISPPPRSVTMMRSPSRRWLATDMDRCPPKTISSADAGVAVASAMKTKRYFMLAEGLHVRVEHAHAQFARIPVCSVRDHRGHIGLIDRDLQVHDIRGSKLRGRYDRLTDELLLRFEHERIDRLIAQRNGDLLRFREEAGMIEVQVQHHILLGIAHRQRRFLS